MTKFSQAAHEYAKKNKERFLNELKQLVAIESISTQKAKDAETQKVAEWLVERLSSIGLEPTLLHSEHGRHPVVYAHQHVADDLPTVLLYSHYDVQPAEIADGWDTPPFTPTEQDGKLYGRGTADTKANALSLVNAVEAILKTSEDGKLPVNVIFAIEGEEESGGETFADLVEKHPEKFKADIGIICDGGVIDDEQPYMAVSLRGIIAMELVVKGPITDIHSGQYGGVVHNPIQALSEILATLHDADGHISVDGFYDDVRTFSEEERKKLEPANEILKLGWEENVAAPGRWGEPDYNLQERIGIRPTLEINGIRGGYAADGFKTVIPHMALAKISCRLVANQDPEKIFTAVEKHIKAHSPKSVEVHLQSLDEGAPALLLGLDSPVTKIMQNALEAHWPKEVIFGMVGGSIPITNRLSKIIPNLSIVGVAHQGSRVHGPNEHIYVNNFHRGIDAIITFLHGCAENKQDFVQ